MTVHKIRHLPTLPSLLLSPQKPLIHRDLSWLQFNERVLAEGRSSSGNPLLERVKFVAISAMNLDEFFMIRFASLNRKILKAAPGRVRTLADRRLMEIRSNILETTAEFGAKQTEVLDSFRGDLGLRGIHIIKRAREKQEWLTLGRKVFEEKIFANLHPPIDFKYTKINELENLQMGVVFASGSWFQIPKTIPPVLSWIDPEHKMACFFFLDDLLLTFLGEAFKLKGRPGIVRMTRDSDFTANLEDDEDPDSIPDIVRKNLGAREKGTSVRLQYRGEISPETYQRFMRASKLISSQLFPAPGSLCLHGLWAVVKETPEALATQPGLTYPALAKSIPKPFREAGRMFEKLKKHDYLFHHPYDSFDAFIEWLKAASKDKFVVSIEQTIYRADAGSPVIEILKQAAKTKLVRVIIELRARFDEMNNLSLADELQRAGVEVSFGFGALKLHAKITLVTRCEKGETQLYTHLSTGNYNTATARQYTDLAILTGRREIGMDAKSFFDSAWKGKLPRGFKHLVSAPIQIHRKLLNHISEETKAAKRGEKTRILAKVNALVDESVIAALYEASLAGVQVDLIVRGACSLIPRVAGISRNIRVISVVDRFLEHSRIYYFESQKAMYLSSADWMPRNFFSRLEIAFPVLDPKIFSFIKDVLFPTYLSDNVKAKELTQQGTWKKRNSANGGKPARAQFFFEKLALEDYIGTPLE